MKKILFFLISYAVLTSTFAQNCEPDPQYRDSTAGVYPAPITDLNPDGGIQDVACIGSYYETVLTVIMPDSVELNIFGDVVTLNLLSAKIAEEGAIEGLPSGITYVCSSSDCTFPSESEGCLLLYGTIPDTEAEGNYPLSISLEITVDVFGTQVIEFPGPQFPGDYFLPVAATGSPLCISSASSRMESKITISPNPSFVGRQIQIHGIETYQNLAYQIIDLTGMVLQKGVLSSPYINMNDELSVGYYFLRLSHQNRDVVQLPFVMY